jgi:hypothetical protein
MISVLAFPVVLAGVLSLITLLVSSSPFIPLIAAAYLFIAVHAGSILPL